MEPNLFTTVRFKRVSGGFVRVTEVTKDKAEKVVRSYSITIKSAEKLHDKMRMMLAPLTQIVIDFKLEKK
jgi:hypothetical protein